MPKRKHSHFFVASPKALPRACPCQSRMNTFSLKFLLGFALGCVLCGSVWTQDGQDVDPDDTTTPDYQLVLVQAVSIV